MTKTGNIATMREALEYVLQFDASDEAAEEDGLTDAERIAEYADHIEECQKKARAALAAPLGTAKEQEERFMEFCDSHWDLNNADGECMECPLNKEIGTECGFAWMQMPYEGKE